MQAMNKGDIVQLDSRYVKCAECAENQMGIERRLQAIEIKQTAIETKTKILLWLASAICGGVITLLIKLIDV